MTTAEMYKRTLGDRVIQTNEFTRNGWETTEIIIREDDGHTRLVWDVGMPYPVVWVKSVASPFDAVLGPLRLDGPEVDGLRLQVRKAFDASFRSDRVWAGDPKFNQFVSHDPRLQRA